MLALTLLYWTSVDIEPSSNTVRQKPDGYSPKSGVATDKSAVKVFIVEDEPTTIILTEAMLNQLGYSTVGVATSFEKAMAALKATSVDIVLVDLTLSGTKTGYDVIKELNRLNIPSVLISGTINEQTLKKIVELDVYGYLPKPYDSLALSTTIQLALKKFTRMQDRIFDEADSIKSRILSNQALEAELGVSEKLYLIKKDLGNKAETQNEGLSYHRAVQWMVGLSLFLVAVASLGYLFNKPFFLAFAKHASTMKVNTALCIVLFSMSLTIENSVKATSTLRLASLSLLAATFFLAALSLLQYTFSLDLGIDQFFIRDRFVNEFNLPGRMAIPTAVSFTILPLALIFNRLKSYKFNIQFTEGFAIVTLFMAVVGAFGHLFNQIEFNNAIPYLAQSRVTLIIQVLLALGVLFLNPKKGLMSIFSNQRVSAKLGRKMLYSVNASMVLISLIIYYLIPQSEFNNLEVVFTLITSITILSSVILWSTLNQIRNEIHIEKTIKLLKNRERELQFVLKRVPHPVAVLDKDMRYILVSQKWIEDLNLKTKNLIGHTIYETFPQTPEKIRTLHHRALSGEIVKMSDEDIFDNAGNKISIKGEIRPWYDIDDQIAGIIIFFESSKVLRPDRQQ